MASIAHARDRIWQVSNTITTGGTIFVTGPGPAGALNFRDRFANGSVVFLELWAGTQYEFSYGTLVYGADANSDSIVSRVIDVSSSGPASPIAWGSGERNATCMVSGESILNRINALGELNGAQVIAARGHLGLLSAALFSAARFGLVDSGWTGGTNGKVVRWSGADTLTDAANTDTTDELYALALKMAEGYYLPGSLVTGLSGFTAGAVYYLSTAGGLTTTAPTPSGSVRRVAIGKAFSTTSLLFTPGLPITG